MISGMTLQASSKRQSDAVICGVMSSSACAPVSTDERRAPGRTIRTKKEDAQPDDEHEQVIDFRGVASSPAAGNNQIRNQFILRVPVPPDRACAPFASVQNRNSIDPRISTVSHAAASHDVASRTAHSRAHAGS